MKIDSTSKAVGGQSSASPGVAARTVSTPPGTAQPAGLQVELSHTAGLKQAGEVFDANRVAEIRQAIAEGRFQINPEKIADGLLDSVRSMLSRQQPDPS